METLTCLEAAGTFTVQKAEEFVVGEKFKHLSKDKNDLRLHFDKHFIRLILEPTKDRRLSLNNPIELEKFKLSGEREVRRSQIKKELGGETIPIDMFWPILFALLSGQPNGEEKDDRFLTTVHGYRNSFTVKLIHGGISDVVAAWNGSKRYWEISVPEINHDPSWIAGRSFFIIPLPF